MQLSSQLTCFTFKIARLNHFSGFSINFIFIVYEKLQLTSFYKVNISFSFLKYGDAQKHGDGSFSQKIESANPVQLS